MRIAIVTGASSGMGAEAARQIDMLYKNLDEIWLIARSKERLQKTAVGISKKTRLISLDLARKSSIRSFSKLLEKEMPEVRILVNAAGYGMIGSAEELSDEIQTGMIDINCRGLTNMTLIVLPYMDRGSRILEFASAAAFMAQPGFAVYAATKSYVLSFSRALYEELKPRGISVTAVCPGPVDTSFFRIAQKYHKAAAAKKWIMASPEQVVRQALIDALKRKRMSVYGVSMKRRIS